MSNNILDGIDLQELGKQLQQARKQQRLTQADAAAIIGVSRTTMTAIEAGQRKIKPAELIKLAEAYNRNVTDFVRSRPIIQPFAAHFPTLSNPTTSDETQIIQTLNQFQQLCTNYNELEKTLSRPPIRNYPPIYKYGHMKTDQAAESLAIAERNRLGIGNGPLTSLRDTLEQAVGLRIFYLAFATHKYSALYLFEPTLGGCIALNQHHPYDQNRISLAREYAHFLAYRTTPIMRYEQYKRKPARERFADSFARYFLMPSASLNQRFNALYQAKGRMTPADLLRLAHEYGVSVEVITHRLQEMQLLPLNSWIMLQKRPFQIRETQTQLGLGQFPESQEKLPNGYVTLVMEAYHQEKITIGEVAHFLQVDLLEARERTVELTWTESINEDIMQLA